MRNRKGEHLPCRFRGAVMVATLLALILLAALVFYVFNLGRASQQRIVAQNAADATAQAGAGWVARSMNTVAMNNIAMSRLIALVNVMDSAPMAITHTTIDQIALAASIERQLSLGVSDAWVRDALVEVLAAVQQEIVTLETVDARLNQSGFDIRTMTYYDGPNGRGQFWQAMESLDAASQATMNRLAEATQLAAIEGGQFNLHESDPSVAMLLPVAIDIPYERGKFDDFEVAVGNDESPGGLTPQAVETARDDDWSLYRGPFDTVFGWRYIDTHTQSWSSGSSRGNVPIGSGSQGSWQDRDPDPQYYTTFGPQAWMMDRLGWFRLEHLEYSRFAFTSWLISPRSLGQTGYWMNELSQIRHVYLWPGEGTIRVVHPQWEIDLNDAAAVAAANEDRIHHTRFVIVEIKSKYPLNHPLFLSDGSWAHVEDNNAISPRVYYGRGWVNPRQWAADKVDDDIWRDEWEYTTLSDPDIGIEPTFDEDGNPVIQPVYRIDTFVFAGVDIGEEEDVLSPHNFSSKSALPAPIDFVHDQVPIDDSSRRAYFTYLGVVQQDGRGKMWSRKFDGESARSRMALAQARVFNNHSWDLWTPMWHAQLEPIDDYEDWLGTFERDIGDAAAFPELAEVDLDAVLTNLISMQLLADVMLEH